MKFATIISTCLFLLVAGEAEVASESTSKIKTEEPAATE